MLGGCISGSLQQWSILTGFLASIVICPIISLCCLETLFPGQNASGHVNIGLVVSIQQSFSLISGPVIVSKLSLKTLLLLHVLLLFFHNKQFNTFSVPGGVCPEGVCPEGVCPEGVCPEGVCPEGVCPEGVCPDVVTSPSEISLFMYQ